MVVVEREVVEEVEGLTRAQAVFHRHNNPQWAKEYDELADKLRRALGGET